MSESYHSSAKRYTDDPNILRIASHADAVVVGLQQQLKERSRAAWVELRDDRDFWLTRSRELEAERNALRKAGEAVLTLADGMMNDTFVVPWEPFQALRTEIARIRGEETT